MGALGVGFGLGFLVSAQLGPVSLLVIRSVLRGGLAVGLAMAAAVGLIDAGYATLGVLGAGRLLTVEELRVTLGLVGAGVLAWFGARTLWSAFRARSGAELEIEVALPRAAFLTALAATASNPLTIISWAAVFAAASTASVISAGTASAAALLVGVLAGSFTWLAVLSGALSITRRRLGRRAMVAVDGAAGAGLLGFAGALGYRTLHD
jgi:threonine/homoserine/homoserine lactone efflux protein